MTNLVVSGDYKHCSVCSDGEKFFISTSFNSDKWVVISRDSLESYQVLSKNSDPSFASIFIRSTIGGALFGETGEMLGALTADSKNTYQIGIQLKDGKKSVIELEERFFKMFVSLFSEIKYRS